MPSHVYFVFSNIDAGLDTFRDVLPRLRARRQDLRLVALDLCHFYGNPTDRDTLQSLFDQVYFLHKAIEAKGLADEYDPERAATLLLKRFFGETPPELIVTNNDRVFPERLVIDMAREAGVPTLLIQESIRRDRVFKDDSLPKHGQGGCDRILAWGEQGFRYFQAVGAPYQRLAITGSTRLDRLVREIAKADREALREAHGIKPRHTVTLVTTCPMNSVSRWDSADYKQAMKTVFRAAAKAEEKFGKQTVIIKPHRCEHEAFVHRGYIETIKKQKYLKYGYKMPLQDALAVSDSVLNFSSSVAVEAAAVGLPVGQLDLMPDKDMGVDYVERGIATRLDDLNAIIRFMRKAPGTRPDPAALDWYLAHRGEAAEKTAEAILELLDARPVQGGRRPLRILGLQPALKGLTVHPFFGGKDVTAYNVAREIVNQGHEAFIFPSDGENCFDTFPYSLGPDGGFATVMPSCQKTTPEAVEAYIRKRKADEPDLDLTDPTLLAGLTADFVSDREIAIRRVLNRVRPDLIHNHYTNLKDPVVDEIKQLAPDTPVILTHYSEGVGTFIDRYDHVVFLSQEQRDMICAEHPGLRDRCSIIHPDVPAAYCGPLEPRTDGPLLFVGTMRKNAPERKGLPLLLDAYRRCPELNRHPLHVIGDGPDRADWEACARRFGLNITFLGWLQPEAIAEEMRKARLFVMPSRGEGLAYVYLEALCMGLPLIGFPPNMRELNRICGLEVGRAYDAESGDVDKLARLIGESADDREFLDPDKRAQAARIARSTFAPGSTARHYLDLYRNLLTDSGR
ncbi:MAG: glycosyltransferase [Opitutales bacterium]